MLTQIHFSTTGADHPLLRAAIGEYLVEKYNFRKQTTCRYQNYPLSHDDCVRIFNEMREFSNAFANAELKEVRITNHPNLTIHIKNDSTAGRKRASVY